MEESYQLNLVLLVCIGDLVHSSLIQPVSADDLEALQRALVANAEALNVPTEMETTETQEIPTELTASLVPAFSSGAEQIQQAVAPFLNTTLEDEDAFSILEDSDEDEEVEEDL